MDDGSTCIVATEAFYAPKSPHKLLSESAFKKCRQLYIGPDQGIGGCTIWKYSNNLIVGRVTCKNGLYVVRLAPTPQYTAHAFIQQLNINILYRRLGHVGKDILQKVAKMGDFTLIGTLAQYKAYHLATVKRQIS